MMDTFFYYFLGSRWATLFVIPLLSAVLMATCINFHGSPLDSQS